MINKNEKVRLEITDLTNLGMGISHIDGITVFVSGGVTGDVVNAVIIKVAKSYLVAKITDFIVKSAYRQERGCEISNRCGGCAFQDVSYSYELEIKKSFVASCMKKSGLPDVEVLPVLHGDKPYGYRNKIQYPVGQNGIGYYANKSHDIVTGKEPCALHYPIFNPAIEILKEFIAKYKIEPYDENTGKGILRHIYLRTGCGTKDGEILVCLVINGDTLPHGNELALMLSAYKSVSGIMLNCNDKNTNVILGDKYKLLWGKSSIRDNLCGLLFDISPASFYQVNRKTAELLINTALSLTDIKKGDIIADLFCGIGTIGMIFKKNSEASKLIGVEIVPQAVENAKSNAILNEMDNTEFYCGDANEPHLQSADIIIVDPPRKGLEEKLIRRIVELSPRSLTYISCDSATLARDMKLFSDLGYKTDKVQPVDMFPRTSHVEDIAVLRKEKLN